MLLILICVFAYLWGSIPFGLLYGKLLIGKDIRDQGSGNIGATNALRLGGKSLGLLTLLSDMIKGMFAIYTAELLGGTSLDIYLAAFFAIIGHVFPVWLNFKGGKGVSVAFSTVFMIAPIVGLNLLLIWAGVFWKYRISSLASLIAAVLLFPLSLIFGVWWLFALVVSGVILYAHRDNLIALIQGKEKKIEKLS